MCNVKQLTGRGWLGYQGLVQTPYPEQSTSALQQPSLGQQSQKQQQLPSHESQQQQLPSHEPQRQQLPSHEPQQLPNHEPQKQQPLVYVPQPQKQQHTSYYSQEKQLGYGQQLPSLSFSLSRATASKAAATWLQASNRSRCLDMCL